MAFGTSVSRGPARGGSPGFRFTLYAIASIVVMFLDQREGWLERARFVLQAASYPLQLAVSSPTAAWSWLRESFATRDALRSENNKLRLQQRDILLRSMRLEELEHENAQLRGLRDALPSVADHWLVSEVVNVQLNSLRQRVLLNRGTANAVFKGQAVMDEKGLLGQTLHVGPWSSEVILITDPEHAVPVQVERNGLRTIAVGAGDTASLALPYLPANADVKSGDLLVTSGLGGVFPAGYPVARIAEIHRDAVQPLAQVRAIPLGRIELDREVMLVWFRPEHPAAPGAATMADTKKGNPAMQPQLAPPKPKPKPPAPEQPTAASGTAPPAAATPKPASPKASAASKSQAGSPAATGAPTSGTAPTTSGPATAEPKAPATARPKPAPTETEPVPANEPAKPAAQEQ